MKRTKRLAYKEIRFRSSRLDARRLAALAKQRELTPSEVMRRLLAEECARTNVAVEP